MIRSWAVRAVRTLVVDRQLVVAGVLAQALDAHPRVDVVGCCDTGGDLAAQLERLEPDVVVIDEITWRNRVVCEAFAGGATASPASPIVVTESRDAVTTAAVLREGACGVVSKEASLAEVFGAIETVAATGRSIAPDLVTEVLAVLLSTPVGPSDEELKLRTLSARESEVLSHLLAGLARPEIAERMFISPNTVRSHVGNILRKLGVGSVVGAVAIGNRAGVRPSAAVRG